ncbi:MAG TPA: ATP-dependent DNA helicase RecQ [bacterium]|nr:ATP-dependent DNA helicase RecQ [bacterium]
MLPAIQESEESLPTEWLALLRDRFGHSGFRHGQEGILRSVFQLRDTLAVMPTGGGKSLCYQLPALARPGLTVVVSPLISLMKDQVRLLRQRGIPAGCLHTGQSYQEKREVFAELGSNDRFLLYLSPERVQKPGFATWLQGRPISLFAIDEAHCVSAWGPDFRQDYHRLSLLRELRPEVPILALTATATPRVLKDIATQLKMEGAARHVYGFYRPNLFYQVETCESDLVKTAWLKQALSQHPTGKILIYCGTRKQCESLREELSRSFAGVDLYHAGLETEQRHQVQADFAAGTTRILAATNAFGMGIDHPDVRLVVHFQMPANIESYYQEIGRAGRDGQDSTCLLLYAKRDKGLHAYFIGQSQAEARHLDQRWRALETMVQFVEGGECRHAGILTYFRDSQRITACGHCEVCAPDSPRRVHLDREKIPLPATRSRKGKARSEAPLDASGQERREALQEWRKTFAKSQDVPAFLVFSNKTLDDLAAKNPGSLDALASVYGLGPQKIERFGAEILAVLRS